MASNYEFLPGRGFQYSGRIRSLVQKAQKHKKRPEKAKETYNQSRLKQVVPYADAKNLLQSQFDPFQTLPAHTSHADNIMLHHCNLLSMSPLCSEAYSDTDVTDSVPHFGRHRPEAFFPPRDLDWPLVRTDPLTLSAAVAFAAMSLALLDAPRLESVVFAETCRAKTLTILRQRLERERQSPSDGLIHTLIGIVAVDTHIRMGLQPLLQEDNVKLHVDGLRAMVDARYGWDMFRYHPVIAWELTW